MWKANAFMIHTLQGEGRRKNKPCCGTLLSSVLCYHNSDVWPLSVHYPKWRWEREAGIWWQRRSRSKTACLCAQIWICKQQNIKLVSAGAVFPVAYSRIGLIQLRPIQLWCVHNSVLPPASNAQQGGKPYFTQYAITVPIWLTVYSLKAL